MISKKFNEGVKLKLESFEISEHTLHKNCPLLMGCPPYQISIPLVVQVEVMQMDIESKFTSATSFLDKC